MLGQARAPEQAAAGLMSCSSLPHAIHKKCIAGHSKAVNFASLEKTGFPFAPPPESLACMKTSKRELRAMQQEVQHGPYRSTLYCWMVDHHAELLAQGSGGRMAWLKLCKRFVKLGLTDGMGKVPTPLRASRTWREACIEVQARLDRQAAAAAARAPPSHGRHRPDWQPQTAAAQPQPVVRGVSAPQTRNPVTPPANTQLGSAHVEAQLAALDRQFAYIDRHIVQQPDEE